MLRLLRSSVENEFSVCNVLKKEKESCTTLPWHQAALVVKNAPANAEARGAGSSPGREGPLEEGMATHSSILAWRLPWTGEPGP